ncbi:MAG: polysaccharide pyruvyl transferase family protein [Candidatus Saccharibacteria bacterium]|nr:polysaccharide pyruvyl transferase family protein [Candidatus Saccharibacteria bacterium]
MKIVYVGDNRHRQNFGCRATSTALSQIISEENEIVGRIYGDYTNFDPGNQFFYQHFPSFVYKRLGRKKESHREYIRQLFYAKNRIIKHGRYFFSNYDFISYDFEKSIKNLKRMIPANPELEAFDLDRYDFDALVVNGEGSFIFATPPWRECLIEAMLMYWAEKKGKKVYYLNGMLSDDPYSKRNYKTIDIVAPIFERAEVVGVRERFSLEYAKENFPKANIQYYPDALFSWYDLINDGFEVKNGKYFAGVNGATDEAYNELDFSEKYILVSGSSSVMLAADGDIKRIVSIYSKLTNELKEAFPEHKVYLVEVCEGDRFLRKVSEYTGAPLIASDTPIVAAGKILANADVFISGRYHPGILASLGGTPCVFMSSNSHKTKSVQEVLDYGDIVEYDVLPDKEERKKIVESAVKKVALGEALRETIRLRCRKLSEMTKEQGKLFRE